MEKLNLKHIKNITNIGRVISAISVLTVGIFSAKMQKQASRVGRFKAKQELMQNPYNFIYVDDKKLENINDVKIEPPKKEGIFKFLKKAWKNNKEFEEYKKTTAKKEAKFFKALESIELTDEQKKDAKRLQKNTFRTFNKVDENSQKYSESIEALSQAISYPLGIIFSTIGVIVGLPYLLKQSKNSVESAKNISAYIGIIILSLLPSIGIDLYITKEQKKASRIAGMLAINDLNDYRKFR